jgi:hypothetical protein
MNKIPVFYHVPKCAGTYAISLMWELLRLHSGAAYSRRLENTICNVCVLSKNQKQIELRAIVWDKKLFCKDNSFFTKSETENDFFLNIDDIHILQNLNIFALIVEAKGISNCNELLKNFQNFELVPFIFLRDPFSLNRSLYSYLTNSSSIHEFTHGSFNGLSLDEYMSSFYVSDSWLIRNLLKLEDTHNISELEYTKTIEILNNFNVSDYKKVEEIINNVFLKCYDLDVNCIDDYSYEQIQKRRNRSNTEHLKLSNLDTETQKKFLERTYWDQKLYDHYVQKNP